LKKIFAREGVDVIPLQSGADYLIREISGTGPVETVVLGSAPVDTGVADQALMTAVSALPVSFERSISLEEVPVLGSHIMNGKAVLPVALIVEWLAHGAIHQSPGLVFKGLDDLCVYKGVILENGARLDLQIHAGALQESGGEHYVPVELRQGKTLHAGARIVLGNDFDPAGTPLNPPVSGKYSLDDGKIYTAGRLFHGNELHGIETISACSNHGITGRAKAAPNPSAWMRQPIHTGWLSEPLALDSAFQMMILWCFEKFGIGSLPTRITRYRQFRRSFPKQGTDINICIDSTGNHEARASIEFLDINGALVARIDGYECVMDASLNEAFKRNQPVTEPQA